jgi:predicted TIM-barrel fold metal-dependent hydrolase
MDPVIIVSADGHGSMPPELWPEYLDKKYHYLLPQLVAENKLYNETMWLLNDMQLAPDKFDVFDRDGVYQAKAWKGLWDLDTRIEQMDREGVAAEFVFHGDFRTSDLFNNIMNGIYPPDAMDAGMQAFDRWAFDNFGPARDRLLLTASNASGTNVDLLLNELDWIADHGFVGTYAPGWSAVPGLPPLYDEYWDPVWARYADHGLVVVIHGGYGMDQGYAFGEIARSYGKIKAQGGSDLDLIIDLTAGIFTDDFFTDLHCRQALAQFMLGGVMDRHPDLKVMMTEVRADWVPATLQYLDKVFAEHRDDLPAQRPPSEYWRTNFLAGLSFMHRAEVEHRDEIGVDNLDFGRDYPHGESTWPNTEDYLKVLLAGVPEDDARKILGENVVRFLGLDRDHLLEVARRISLDIHELIAPNAAETVDPALVDHLADRCGVLKPLEGGLRLPALEKLLEPDLARLVGSAA